VQPTLSTYYHTIRNLTRRQVAAQLSNRFRPLISSPTAFFRKPVPAYPGCQGISSARFLPPGGQGSVQSHATTGDFTFLNRTEHTGWPPRWDCNKLPRLWQYNLHYFDWIWNIDEDQAYTVVDDWISRYPLKRHQTGWEPYPTSLRLMNWAAFFFCVHRERTEADIEFINRIWNSLYKQAEWLRRNLEYHLLANHLLENAAALTFTGACFAGSEANLWKETGLTVLKTELDEQILPDGVHFERSPMYHTRVLYVLLLLASTEDPDVLSLVREPILRLARSLPRLCHPDGGIALLNDSAFGIYNEPKELLDYAAELFPDADIRQNIKPGPFAVPDAGYYGWVGKEGHYIICDAGTPGPVYQPGHAHAGIFSFELSLFGHRLIVDSGVCTYEKGEDRDYCRSTRAHNTVEIAGRDQVEMWSSFRIGRRAKVNVLDWRPSPRGFTLEAVHDGYTRLKPGLLHKRRFNWDAEGSLLVNDFLEGPNTGEALSRLHLHPDCHVDQMDVNSVSANIDTIKFKIEWHGKGTMDIQDSPYFPEFGRSIANKQIEFRPIAGVKDFGFSIRVIQ
jgi:uncharacterized heparinase superfamily protein